MAKEKMNGMSVDEALSILKGDLNVTSYSKVQKALRVAKENLDAYSYLNISKNIEKLQSSISDEKAPAMTNDEALNILKGDLSVASYSKVQEALHVAKANLDAYSYLKLVQKIEKAENLSDTSKAQSATQKLETKTDTSKIGKMSTDEALSILKGDIYAYSYGKVQEAVALLKEKDPTNPVLKAFLERQSSFEKQNNLQSNNAQEYEDNTKNIEDVVSKYSFDKFLDAKDNKDIADYVIKTEVQDSVSGKKLDDKGKKNYLNLLFEGAKIKAQTLLSGSEDFAKMSKTAQIKAVKDEIKTIFFADFAQTAIASSLEKPNKSEQRLGSQAYKQYILRQTQKAQEVFGDIVEGGKKIKIKTDNILSSCADTAVNIENYVRALRYKAQENLAKVSKDAVKGISAGAKNLADKATAGAQKIADKATEEAKDLADKAAIEAQKIAAKTADKFTLLANNIQNKKNKLEQLANKISDNRYEIWKNIKGSFHDNKIKLFGNVAANAAFGFWTAAAASGAAVAGVGAAPVLVPAIAVYAAYHAAGAWVYPVVAEMRKINRKRKEDGQKALPFKQALKQAWHNKMSSRKDKRAYIVGGVVNTGLAVAGFAWLKDGLEAADTVNTLVGGAKEGLNVTLASNIAETRHAISLGRSGAATVAQLTDAAIAYGVSVNDPNNKEKANEFKQTAIAALAGAGLNIAFQGWGFAHGQNHPAEILSNTQTTTASETTAEGRSGWLKNLWQSIVKPADKPDTSASDIVPPAEIVKPDTTAVQTVVEPQVPASAEISVFPDKYSPDMGISKNEYNILVTTTEGTLKSATGEQITLDRAYTNLDAAMANFPDKTKEEIMYKFNRLYAFMRKAYEVGDGTLRETPSGADYLENKFETLNLKLDDDKMSVLVQFAQKNTYADKAELTKGLKELFPEGLSAKDNAAIITTIHSNQRFYQHQEEMEALINLLGCGEQITAKQAVAINKLLDNTDALLATGKENTQLTGLSLAKDCHDDDGEWVRVATQEPVIPQAPDIDTDIKVDNDDIHVDNAPLNLTQDDFHVDRMEYEPEPARMPMSYIEPEPKQKQVRKVIITGMSQLEGENAPEKEKVLDSKRAARLLKRFGQNSKE